jgi:hypothetical protein
MGTVTLEVGANNPFGIRSEIDAQAVHDPFSTCIVASTVAKN